MENARLLTETREALDQQTATAEVLQVINSSPGDLAPVFQAIVEKAHTLCSAVCGSLQLWDGEKFRGLAMRGFSEAMAEELRRGYIPGPNHPCRRVLEGERVAHCADLAEIDDRVTRAGGVALGGVRTILFVALRKDDALLGQIVAARQEARPFTAKEIALVENFAAQAVIAMENARLITETREALEQQTATAEVLQVINASPGDLAPVFDAMLEKAMQLCSAAFGELHTFDGERFHTAAQRGGPPEFVAVRARTSLSGRPGTASGRILETKRTLHIPDLKAEDAYRTGEPTRHDSVDLGGIRTLLAVPLVRDDKVVGLVAIYRHEVRPFSAREIMLLENFAAQAVIAMENARLLTETREALEQQTATAEVLQVINSSPGDLAPVFDRMLDKAMHLCGSAFGALFTYDGECFPCVATRGFPPALLEYYREPVRTLPGSAMEQLVRGESTSQVTDIRTDALQSPLRRALAELAGARTMIWVALRKEKAVLGCIAIYRQEVRPFSDKEIALLQNFAAQAVIAMENARLLGELRDRTHDLEESLEYQTATSDVLKVISRSTVEVLDTVAATAARLCEADLALINSRDDDVFRTVATFATSPEYNLLLHSRPFALDHGSLTGRVALDRNVVHIADITADPDYTHAESVTVGKLRSVLGVPLMREGGVVGTIALGRQRVEPFTERQIGLVRTFADQAVIAIENTRLLTETREALEQQTATAEILEVINRSPGDLSPVFDAILEKAHRLCGAEIGSLNIYDGEENRAVATRGLALSFADRLRQGFRPGAAHPIQQLLSGARIVQVPDSAEVADPIARAAFEVAGIRTVLLVPLRKNDRLLGQIVAGRQEVRLFSDKDISLLENFAAQAVIAMDNARLLNEIRQRQAELSVTFDNMGDGVAMFDSDQRIASGFLISCAIPAVVGAVTRVWR